MYGERYMDRPEQNPEGYAANSLLHHTENLKGKLLLIHGTVDDVVVMQHNEALLMSFIDNGVQADYFVYPMHPHNVSGIDRAHLMEKVLMYIIDNNK
jgi:dipeptidyl-peptidase-4